MPKAIPDIKGYINNFRFFGKLKDGLIASSINIEKVSLQNAVTGPGALANTIKMDANEIEVIAVINIAENFSFCIVGRTRYRIRKFLFCVF